LVALLKEDTQRYIYKVPRPYPPQKGGILFRRAVYSISDVDNKIREAVVDAVRLNWLNPPCSVWRMLHAIAFEVDNMHTFAVFIQRLGPVDSGHTDLDDGEKNGRLSLGLGPIKTLPDAALSLAMTDVQSGATSQFLVPENLGALMDRPKEIPPFANINEGLQYFWNNPEEIPYKHEMAAPRDEWRLNLAGYADVYIAVERMYLDDDDSDEYTSERGSDCFIDIVDLVIRVKGDPGYRGPKGNEDSGLEDVGNADGGSEEQVNDDEGKIQD
jgi:hypothetical protein